MKPYLSILLFLLCSLLLSACGTESNPFGNQSVKTEIHDIRVEEEEIFHTEFDELNLHAFLGLQYYEDEPLQIIWNDGGIWLLGTDGIAENFLPEYDYFDGTWFLTSGGESVLLYSSLYGGGVYIVNRAGEKLFSLSDISGLDICETEDGKIYLLGEEENSFFIGELNLSNGTVRKLEGLDLNRNNGTNFAPLRSLGFGPDGLMLLDSEGIWEIEEEDGAVSKSMVLSFDGTSYIDMLVFGNRNLNRRNVSDFRVSAEGAAELLWRHQNSGRGDLQVLTPESKERTPITLRCTQVSDWMAECFAEFNKTNENYHIVLEQLPDALITTLEDFQQRTDMEIGAGGGADLIMGQASYNFNALLEKGAVENLAPYLERSGIDRENYFPVAFPQKQDTLYGIMPEIGLLGLWIDSGVLEGTGELSIETIVDALYDYPEKGSISNYPTREILMFLLRGSGDFWGMIDYENGTCSFDTELFRKMLQITKRYGSQAYRDSPAIIGYRSVYPLGYYFENESELQGSEPARTAFGYIFEDGVYSALSWHWVIAINANSENKEGCWEFLSFLLQEEAQRKMLKNNASYLPVNRKVFAEKQAQELVEWSGEEEDMESMEEDAAEQLELVENLHFYPMGTEPLQKIIWDEAKDYINDLKPMEVIIENINNRVQLYLNER